MCVGERVLSILSNCLVEILVFTVRNIFLGAQPNCLDIVDQLPFPNLLLDCLGLGRFSLFSVGVVLVRLLLSCDLNIIDLFFLSIGVVFNLKFLFWLRSIERNLLTDSSGHVKTNRVINEF